MKIGLATVWLSLFCHSVKRRFVKTHMKYEVETRFYFEDKNEVFDTIP